MPGSNRLARELGVGGNTLEGALKILEADGILIPAGPGKRRRIALQDNPKHLSLRIGFLHYDTPARSESYLLDLQHKLESAGHSIIQVPKTLFDLKMNLRRVSKIAEETTVDAWVLTAASREILTWFSQQNKPTFALFGRRRGLPLAGAGPDKVPAYIASVRHLYDLGHRRIVFLTSKMRRLPEPGIPEQAFLNELQVLGLPGGRYNLPDWETTPEGLIQLLDSLFDLTPPTALMIDEASHFLAVQHHLARRGIFAPEKISLICTDAHSAFPWFSPSIAHIKWEADPLIRRIVRWAANVSKGRSDLRQTSTATKLVHGKTIGPVPSPTAAS